MSALEPGDVRFLILVRCEADGWWCAVPEGAQLSVCPVCKREVGPARVAGEGAPAWRVHPLETEASVLRSFLAAAAESREILRTSEGGEDAWEAIGYSRRIAVDEAAGWQAAEWPGLKVLRLKERMIAVRASQDEAMRVARLTVDLPAEEPGQAVLPGLEAEMFKANAARTRDVDL